MKLIQKIIPIAGLLVPAMLASVLPPLEPSAVHTRHPDFNNEEHWHGEHFGNEHPHPPRAAIEHHQPHHMPHSDNSHGKRDVLYTVASVNPIDMKWHVRVWDGFGCTSMTPPMSYANFFDVSTGCVTLPSPGRSFSLHGNMRDCVHYWYWDDTCSAPAEFSAVMGDVNCHVAPGAANQQRLGSFQLKCPNGKTGWKDSTNGPHG